jgi:hypothetical protein
MGSRRLPPRFQRKAWEARWCVAVCLRVPLGSPGEVNEWSCGGEIWISMETPRCWKCQECGTFLRKCNGNR